MKIKVFKFEVCNVYEMASNKSAEWAITARERLNDEKFIEDTINAFIKGKDVVNITISSIEVNKHNNGGSNTWWQYYTISYND